VITTAFRRLVAIVATAALAAVGLAAVTVPAANAASDPALGVTLAQVGNYLLLGGQGSDNQGVV